LYLFVFYSCSWITNRCSPVVATCRYLPLPPHDRQLLTVTIDCCRMTAATQPIGHHRLPAMTVSGQRSCGGDGRATAAAGGRRWLWAVGGGHDKRKEQKKNKKENWLISRNCSRKQKVTFFF